MDGVNNSLWCVSIASSGPTCTCIYDVLCQNKCEFVSFVCSTLYSGASDTDKGHSEKDTSV